MKEIKLSPSLVKKLKIVRQKDQKLYVKIKKQLVIFQKNPKHTSLRLHKLQGNLKNVWSSSVDKQYRLVFINNKSYYFFDFGTHKQVYK